MKRKDNNWQPAAVSSAVCFIAGTLPLWIAGIQSYEAIGFAVVAYLFAIAFFLDAIGVLEIKLRR